MADGDDFGALRTELQRIADKAAKGAAKDPAIELLKKKLAAVEGEQAEALQQVIAKQEEQEKRHSSTVQELVGLFMQNLATQDALIERTDNMSASVLSAVDMAPKPAAPSPQPTAAPRYVVEAPVARQVEETPPEGEPMDPGKVYAGFAGDHDGAVAEAFKKTALEIVEAEREYAYRGEIFISASVDDVIRIVTQRFGFEDSGETWRHLEQGHLPYVRVIQATKYAGVPVDGISADLGSVQRGLEIDRVKLHDAALNALTSVVRRAVEQLD